MTNGINLPASLAVVSDERGPCPVERCRGTLISPPSHWDEARGTYLIRWVCNVCGGAFPPPVPAVGARGEAIR